MKKMLIIVALLAVASPAFAVNLVVNGDWGTGDETGWTRWTAGRPTEAWAVTSNGPTPPEGTLSATGKANDPSFGWYQVIEVPASEEVTLSGDWTATNASWVEYMLFSVASVDPVAIVGRLDSGAAADVAYKRDGWGMNGGGTFGWESATLSPHPSGNGGTIHSLGFVVVGLKLGLSQWLEPTSDTASFDNIALTPEPAAMLLLGLPLLLIRRRRA